MSQAVVPLPGPSYAARLASEAAHRKDGLANKELLTVVLNINTVPRKTKLVLAKLQWAQNVITQCIPKNLILY